MGFGDLPVLRSPQNLVSFVHLPLRVPLALSVEFITFFVEQLGPILAAPKTFLVTDLTNKNDGLIHQGGDI